MNERSGAEERRARHPVRVVSRRTGLSPHVLRAWERRYGAVEPVRTGGGQRLYTDADVERLRLLRRVVQAGWPISQAAVLADAELVGVLAAERQQPSNGGAVASAGGEETSSYLPACLRAAEALDEETLGRLLMRAVVSLRPRDFIDGVVWPLLHEVGERWHRGELRPAHEHAVSVAVRGVLGFLLSAYEAVADAPTLVSTTLAGDRHEFGALLASVVAAESGWRVVYLGPSLPVEEIARAAAERGAAAVAVSVVDGRPAAELAGALESLRARLRADVRLLAGGRTAALHAAVLERIGGVEFGDLELLRRALPRVGATEVRT